MSGIFCILKEPLQPHKPKIKREKKSKFQRTHTTQEKFRDWVL